MSRESELGTLIVVVLKARNLVDKHSFYKQDVFAQASLNGTVKKTPVDVKGGQHPVWDSELRFPVFKTVSDKTRKIEVSCFAKEHRSDDPLGKGTIDITDTLKTGEFDDWVSLDIDGAARGEVYLEMTFFSSAPAPAVPKSSVVSLTVPHGQDLIRRPSKLSPSERLYRPPQLTSLTVSQAGNHPSSPASQGRHSLPASLSPSKGRDSAVPPLPGDQSGAKPFPSILKAGGASKPYQDPQTSKIGTPSILRPGNGISPSPSPQSLDLAHVASVPLGAPLASSPGPYRQHPSYGYSSYNEPYSANPYLSGPPPVSSLTPAISPGGNTTVPLANYSGYTNRAVPPTWNQSDAITPDLSFPMPTAPNNSYSGLLQAEPYQDSRYYEPAVPVIIPSPSTDMYHSTRYQTPLPLPQDASVTTVSSHPHSHSSELRLDSDRQEALRKAEDDAVRRREQERRDLELALELDRQLNT